MMFTAAKKSAAAAGSGLKGEDILDEIDSLWRGLHHARQQAYLVPPRCAALVNDDRKDVVGLPSLDLDSRVGVCEDRRLSEAARNC